MIHIGRLPDQLGRVGQDLVEDEIVQGNVISKTKSYITVDVNAKNECVIPISEFQLELISNSFSSSLTLVHDCTEIPSFLETHHCDQGGHEQASIRGPDV